jgi:hypothetical protein
MPTGYTSSIKDGITFKEFIMECARAFGATVTMRDEPKNKEIPDKFGVSDYYTNKLSETQTEFENVKAMSGEEIILKARIEYDEKIAYNKQQIKEHNDLRQKYNDMLFEVKKWQPPTSDHHGLKDFMIQQITNSIDFDCDTSYYLKPVELLTGEQWLSHRKHKLLKDIDYYTQEHQKELVRVNGRNEWLLQLRNSL